MRFDKLALFLLLATTLISASLRSQMQLDWAKAWGGDSFDAGLAVTYDLQGNSYVAGYFRDSVDFDPGPGNYFLESNGSEDIFVCKLNSSGNLVWARRIGGSGSDVCTAIHVNNDGSVLITGQYSKTADFDPGPAIFNLTATSNYQDIFICKLNATGNFLWVDNIAGTSIEESKSMSVDASGNIFITGRFLGTVDFDPSLGVNKLSTANANNAFVAKYNDGGALIWVKKIGNSDDIVGYSLRLDASGNILVTGGFSGSVDIDPGANTIFLSAFGSDGYSDIFVLKLTNDGNFIWAKKMGGLQGESGYGISVDGLGNLFVVGGFGGTADFDPSSSTYNLTGSSLYNTFIVKLSSSGDFRWARKFENTSIQWLWGNCICVDSVGNSFFVGRFTSTTDFDPSASTFNLTSAGGQWDGFILHLDSAGAFLWVKGFGNTGNDEAYCVAVNKYGTAYVTGTFVNSVTLGASNGIVSSIGANDVFLAKYLFGPPAPPTHYNFTGSGNWSTPSNWSNNIVPISPIPAGTTILISSTGSNECIIDVPLIFAVGSTLTVQPSAIVKIKSSVRFL